MTHTACAIICRMKRVPAGGYTILEVMIFLSVSGALLVSTMTLISGKEERTRFSQSIGTFEQNINDILNDVSTGYYATNQGLTCETSAASTVDLMAAPLGSVEQGTQGCIFLGKAIRLDVPDSFDAYTMVGVKTATSLSNADATLLGSGTPAKPGVITRNSLGANLEIKKAVSLKAPDFDDLSGIALVSNFSQVSALNGTVTGNATQVTVYEVQGNFETEAGKATMTPATDGILLCLQQSGGSRKATLTIGANNQQLRTETKIVDDWPGECS